MYDYDNNEGSTAGLVTLLEVIIGALVGIAVLLGAVLGLVWFFLHATEAHAEEAPGQPAASASCAPFEQLRQALKEKAHETELSGGMITDTTILTVFASPQGETWTIVIVNTNGIACITASGSNWIDGVTLKGAPV